MLTTSLFTLLLCLALPALSAHLDGLVSLPKHLQSDLHEVRLLLSHEDGVMETIPESPSGLFHFGDLKERAYVLHTTHRVLHFDPLRVDVTKAGDIVVRQMNASRTKLPLPLEVRPVSFVQHFEPVPQFDFLSLLKQPMILIMVVTAGMGYCLPKLMEAVDEDGEMQRQAKDESELIEPIRVKAIKQR